MIWIQTLPAFALWIAYIAIRRSWMHESRERYANLRRGRRIALMLLSVFGSLAVLIVGVTGAGQFGLLTADGVSLQGFLVIAITGLGFVHLQMVATALTLSLALDRETRAVPPTSNQHRSPQEGTGETQ